MTGTFTRVTGIAAMTAAMLGPLALAQQEDKSNSPPNVIDGDELVRALRAGGHVLYFRHGKTDMSTRDSDRGTLSNCATQRILSDEGRRQMTGIGQQFRRLHIPVGDVRASPYCRTLDTARLAFGKVEPEPELEHTVTADAATTRRRAEALKKLLAAVPAAGTNTVLSGHTGNLQEAVGIWPSPEGVAIVFKPDGHGGTRYLATIAPTHWAELSRAPARAASRPKR